MNELNTQLSELSMSKDSKGESSYKPKKSKATIFIIAAVILILYLFIYVGKDHFFNETKVKVVQALAIKSSETAIPAGELAFQSAGWIERAPFPIKATALVSGVIKDIHIIEGGKVKKGDLIAELIDQNLKLELEKVKTELNVAKTAVKQQGNRIVTEGKRLEKLKNLAEIYEKSKDSIPRMEIIKAKQDVSRQQAIIDEMQAEKELKTATIQVIKNRYSKVELHLKRTKICAPENGIILRTVSLQI